MHECLNSNNSKILSILLSPGPPLKKKQNIAKGTTDPGVDNFNQLLWFGLVGLVSRFGLVGLVW